MSSATTNRPKPTVLYIDDQRDNRVVFKATFRDAFNVLAVNGLEEALAYLESREVHVVISDQRMPGLAGSEVLCRIKERFPRVRRMLITAYADLQALVDALNQAGVCHYIHKPWDTGDVLKAVNAAWQDYQEEEERIAYAEKLLESNRQLEFALRQALLS